MSKLVHVTYLITCTTTDEYTELLTFLTDNPKWTILTQDDDNKSISFEADDTVSE